MASSRSYGADDGHLMGSLEDDSFTISLEEKGPIWSEDFGFFIKPAADPTTLVRGDVDITGLQGEVTIEVNY